MRLLVAALSVLLLSACATSAARSNTARAPRRSSLQYTVRLDDSRKRLDVSLCFEGPMPARLVYGTPDAVPFLIAPELLLPEGRHSPLVVKAGVMQLPPQAADGCVAYGVDVQGALDRDALMLAYPGEESLLLAAELFLWRPQVRSPQLQSKLRFVLPPGAQVSTPWRSLPGDPLAFELDESAFAFTGHVVLGDFAAYAVPAPGTHLRAVAMRGFPAETEALISPWLERAARAASLPGARFPVPAAQVIVVPTSPSTFPIFFGHTGRSGGASIILFLPTDTKRERLDDDWIAVHEFSHLWHPFVRRQDAWLSEGIATYWQEVLRARLGFIEREQVWQRLYEGAELGRQAAYSLSEETRRMPFAHNYQIVYWAGAAIALMVDVELRAQSEGRLSLDVLLSRLRQEPEFYLRARTSKEILQAFDRVAGWPVCAAIAQRYMHGELPKLKQLFEQLGVAPDPDRTAPASPTAAEQQAPWAWVRDAILAAPEPKQADMASERSARPMPGS
jgi:hypothetical protein